MAFDGIITRSIVSELNEVLKNSKVNKIMQPTKNEIIIETYGTCGKNFLEICTSSESCRVCLTNFLKQNPKNVYNFCMLLRKHLTGARILEISNMDLERTIEIEFEVRNELNDLVKKRLYIEIMSRQSNVVLTNEDGIIINTLRYYDSGTRELLPAHKFEFVPIQKKSFFELRDFNEFLEIFEKSEGESICQKLTNSFIGFSKTFIFCTLDIFNINDREYYIHDLRKLYDYINELLSKINTNEVEPFLFGEDFTLVLGKKKNETQINEFVDKYYLDKEQKNLFIQSKNNLLRIVSSNLKKVNKKLENINQKLKECDDIERYKICGELLTANLYKIDTTKNLTEVQVFNYYENKDVIIKLDSKINVSKNVEKFFKKYNKLKNTLEIVSKQKKEAEEELGYIESVVFSLENARSLRDIDEIYEEILSSFNINQNQKNIKENINKEFDLKPIDILGFKVYVGKNNIQNEYLSLKFSRKEDLWFHVQKLHGSHVLLRTEGKDDIPEEVIYECGKLAKDNSKGKNAINVAVDYCQAKFVRRAANGKVRNGKLYQF